MNLFKDLTILLHTDSVTYANYVRSLLEMQAAAKATKLRQAALTREYSRKLHRELKTIEQCKGANR